MFKSLNHSESKNPEEGLLESSKWRDRVKLDILQGTTKAVYVCSKINPARLKLIAHKTMTMKGQTKSPGGPESIIGDCILSNYFVKKVRGHRK